MPDDFSRHWESAATQWISQTNLPIHPLNGMPPEVLYIIILLCLKILLINKE
jgi:hypothetical protein